MAESRSSQTCCVPFCSHSKKKQPYLSFHSFPTDEHLKRRWILSIRREEGKGFTVKKGSTFVCAFHFQEDEVLSHPESGRKYLKLQTVPSRFYWNNWGDDEPHQTHVAKGRGFVVEGAADFKSKVIDAAFLLREHDYDYRPLPGALDEAQEMEEPVPCLTLLDRWCLSDEDFRYFTRFSSRHIFFVFWRSVEPSESRIAYWSKARMNGNATVEGPSSERTLQLIDEFFMFCLRVAAGLRERELAEIFGVTTSTVSGILITWSNYLYLVLGSVQIWMTRGQVRQTMPVKFKKYSPNVRVIVDSIELRCESPEAITMHSETFATHKNYITFKSLIGVAPCGAITFASKLFTGAISDKELTRQSGILELLEPGDEVMAEKGFLTGKLLEDVGAKLIISPFKHQTKGTERTQTRLCIFVERAIQRVKEYHIWDSPVPLTLAGSINQMWSCCCMMANYHSPIDFGGEVKFWVE